MPILNVDAMLNQKFNRLLVKKFSHIRSGKRVWECLCDCGNTCFVATGDLRNGQTKSCGCYWKEKHTSHGRHKTREYQTWADMKTRCDNLNHKSYPHYGGRGISYCPRWKTFENFYEDMGDCPEGLTLERINNEDGYYKDNCRWATRAEQNRNKRGVKNYGVSEGGK